MTTKMHRCYMIQISSIPNILIIAIFSLLIMCDVAWAHGLPKEIVYLVGGIYFAIISTISYYIISHLQKNKLRGFPFILTVNITISLLIGLLFGLFSRPKTPYEIENFITFHTAYFSINILQAICLTHVFKRKKWSARQFLPPYILVFYFLLLTMHTVVEQTQRAVRAANAYTSYSEASDPKQKEQFAWNYHHSGYRFIDKDKQAESLSFLRQFYTSQLEERSDIDTTQTIDAVYKLELVVHMQNFKNSDEVVDLLSHILDTDTDDTIKRRVADRLATMAIYTNTKRIITMLQTAYYRESYAEGGHGA